MSDPYRCEERQEASQTGACPHCVYLRPSRFLR
jgi:hypothetical protein